MSVAEVVVWVVMMMMVMVVEMDGGAQEQDSESINTLSKRVDAIISQSRKYLLLR